MERMRTKTVHRGQIYHISGDTKVIGSEQKPNRPGIIVSGNLINHNANVVQIVYLTLAPKKKRYATHVDIMSNKKEAIALCEQIHTVDKSRLQSYIGAITEEEQKLIDKALSFNLFHTIEPEKSHT